MTNTLDRQAVEKHLKHAQDRAIAALAKNKWERFGYWAAMSVHLRQLLGLSNTASPFRDFADLARKKVTELGIQDQGD